jgi:hypothetical protein
MHKILTNTADSLCLSTSALRCHASVLIRASTGLNPNRTSGLLPFIHPICFLVYVTRHAYFLPCLRNFPMHCTDVGDHHQLTRLDCTSYVLPSRWLPPIQSMHEWQPAFPRSSAVYCDPGSLPPAHTTNYTLPILVSNTRLYSTLSWHHLHNDATCTIRVTSSPVRLENPRSTCFQAKQAVKSRRMSNAVFILPSVLWHNQQTVSYSVLRPKPRNSHGDFEAQITKP